MQTSPINVRRTDIRFDSDDRRVIPRFFPVGGDDRVMGLIQRVMHLPEQIIQADLAEVLERFEGRHRDIRGSFAQHFQNVAHWLDNPSSLSDERQLLIGAYFTMEYAIESAALFNPSVVPHPNQDGLAKGEVRILMSLRATGEGHVSSIVFRTGVVDAKGETRFDEITRYVAPMKVLADRFYDKKLFFLKLIEMAAYNEQAHRILDELPERFAYPQLDKLIAEMRGRDAMPGSAAELFDTAVAAADPRQILKDRLPPPPKGRTVVIGAFLALPITEQTALIFGAAIGFCWLGTVPLTSGLVRQIFGARYLSTLYGLVFFTHQVGSFLGAWIGGRIYDYYGSYDPIWWSAAVLAFIAALIHLPINDKPVPRLTVAIA
mgnify:CR=1 FL=1